MFRTYALAVVVAASLALASPGWGQPNPKADELIKSLDPATGTAQEGATRGLHRLGAAETSAGAPAPSASLDVQFATGSAELTPQAMLTLDELGKALSSQALASYHFRIEGHTDTVGSKAYNQALSERRAGAVAAYIEQKFGIESNRVTPVGLGSEHPLVPTPDQTPEARNRRVQVVNVGV